MTDPPTPPDGLNPAATAVFLLLYYDGECRFTQIKAHTNLAGSTVDDALRELRREGIAEANTSMTAPNRKAWRLNPEYRRWAEV